MKAIIYYGHKMARKKITELTEDTSPQLAEYTVTHDGTNAKKVTWQKIKDLFGVAGATAWGSITGTLSAQTDLQSALDAKAATVHTHAISDVTNLQSILDVLQMDVLVISGNTNAVNDGIYNVVASAAFTDPSPSEGKGYVVFVRNGTATIGGTGYATAGSLLYRIYHSGAWATYNVGDVYATNKIAKNVGATYTTNTITTVTAAEYAAIGTPDANTLYFIV